MKLRKGPGKVVEADIESETLIWRERQLGSLCMAVSLPIQALPGELLRGADGRPSHSTHIFPADVFSCSLE